MPRLLGLLVLLGLASLLVDARINHNEKSTMHNDAASITTITKRGLQDCPCDCTDSLLLSGLQEQAFLVQDPVGNVYCIPAAAWVDILNIFPATGCTAPDVMSGGCTTNFGVIPISSGGDLFGDTLGLDDAVGLLDDNVALDDAVDDIFSTTP
jgi:hypothetical protein